MRGACAVFSASPTCARASGGWAAGLPSQPWLWFWSLRAGQISPPRAPTPALLGAEAREAQRIWEEQRSWGLGGYRNDGSSWTETIPYLHIDPAPKEKCICIAARGSCKAHKVFAGPSVA